MRSGSASRRPRSSSPADPLAAAALGHRKQRPARVTRVPARRRDQGAPDSASIRSGRYACPAPTMLGAFAEAIPMWGPRGQVLTGELASLIGRYRGSQRIYLSDEVTKPVLGSPRASVGVTATVAAQLVGERAGHPRGGMKVGAWNARACAETGCSDSLMRSMILSLHDILADQLWFSRVARSCLLGVAAPSTWRWRTSTTWSRGCGSPQLRCRLSAPRNSISFSESGSAGKAA